MIIPRNFIRKNITSFSILLFLILYCVLIYLQPSFLYNLDGSLREFGLGYSRKTVVPIWLLSICLAIISYYLVLYYINFNRIFIH